MDKTTYSEWSREELEEEIARVETEITALQKKATAAEEREALITGIVETKVKLWRMGADVAYDLDACGAVETGAGRFDDPNDFTPTKPKRKSRSKFDRIAQADEVDDEEFTPSKQKRKSRGKIGGPNKKVKKGKSE